MGTQGFLPLFSSLKSSYILFFFFNAVDFLEKMRPREQRWRPGSMTTQQPHPSRIKMPAGGKRAFFFMTRLHISFIFKTELMNMSTDI